MKLRALTLLVLTVLLTACASTQPYQTSVILLRHGESEANAQKIIASNAMGLGQTVGLTSTGREQAQKAAIKIEGLIETGHYKGAVIVASPFKRAMQTADIVADTLTVPVTRVIEPRFQERFFGVFEGLSTDNYEKVWSRDVAGAAPDKDWSVETLESVNTRSKAALESLRKEYEDHAIIIVTHGDVASVMIATDKGADLKKHREIGGLPTAGIAVLSR